MAGPVNKTAETPPPMRKRVLLFLPASTWQKGGWRTGACNDDGGTPGRWWVDGEDRPLGYHHIKYWQELPPTPDE